MRGKLTKGALLLHDNAPANTCQVATAAIHRCVEFITMINGTKRLVMQDYVFHKSYHGSGTKNRRWRCSARQKGCKALVILDTEEKIIKRYQAMLITMNNGKETLLYYGYTFFFRYEMKSGKKWVCTKFPRCKAFLCVNKDETIYPSYPEHNHEKKKLYKCPNAMLITMNNGKETLLYCGYTFFFRYEMKSGQKWVCTKFPTCKAFLCVNKDEMIFLSNLEHNHEKKKLYKCPNGRWLFSDACCAVLIQDQIITKHKIRFRDSSLQECLYSDPFQNIPEDEFLARFRLGKETIRGLIAELSPFIPSPQRKDGVSVATKVIIALSFYASGSYQTWIGLGSLLNVSQVTVSRAIKQVTDALNSIFPKYVKMPDKKRERNEVKSKFYKKFHIPGILGCIDGIHIPIKKPSVHEDVYKNGMGFHSLNTMLICDSDLNILCVDASNPGLTTASSVWQSHPLNVHLNELASNGVQGFLLGIVIVIRIP
ncbi:uncharacterized protein LOC123658007 [Melitaea cinxia]|uniref:uncharacterized protein LOC123658007 n=1 Tax=Melitaea cinxia TaxID=113334 RepID=UPI001E26ED61|nr:uncharacterized protein LOC123658007 [Melitaea cinxia]